MTLSPYNNKNLFTNYYLGSKVKTFHEWNKNDHADAFSKIKKIYDDEKGSFNNFNEAQLIKHFLDPIFKILLFEPETEEAAGSEFPDYAFFKDKVSRDEAHKNKGTISFYTNAIAIGEVKKWDVELDGKPIRQLRNYLDVTVIKWGILTNGKKWRLFCKEEERDDYYEVDLPSLLDSNNLEEFKYFFYFFRRDAFLTLPEVFIEQVLRGSDDHAKAIGNNLKDNVYKAMKKIADGFFGRPQNNLDRNNETARELVQKNTMLLLYRLLFLLYAEDRNLLDLKNPKYMANHSFYRIKKEVEEKRGRSEQGYDNTGTSIWDRLKNLFDLINLGSEAFGEKEFHVPAYNGGLFDVIKNPELEKWKIGDKYLAEAIHLLTWSDINGSGFVDYSDLDIRHLGSIYEGLLEYKLKVAESDIVTKGNEWVSIEKYNEEKKQKKGFEDFDEFNHARKGEMYLATDKGERKATGSYYTPKYIVNYIVKNTVGPVVEEKWKEAEGKKLSLMDATLSVKVLDPAMGSGHFLVGAVEFLADMLQDAAQKDIDAGRLSDEPRFYDKSWARREVVAHCIYGVDLNPMAVELAKVGLWLKTISKDKPLSFLDHRLKQGNSLIGAQLIDLPWYPDLKVKKEKKDETVLKKFEEEVHRPFVDKIVHQLKQLSEIDDDTIEHVRQKKELFEKLKENKQYLQIKSIADVYTAVYFGNETTEVNKNPKFAYNDLFWALKGDDKEWSRKTYKPWFKKAMEIAEDKSFFHWELEFPEIFFEGGAPKENPGWDAVVGNPPYGYLSRDDDKNYFRNLEHYSSGELDAYILFYVHSLETSRTNGRLGFITPDSWLTLLSAEPLRKQIYTNSIVHEVVDMYKPFPDSKDTRTHIFIYEKNIPKEEYNFGVKMVRPTFELDDLKNEFFYKTSTFNSGFLRNNITCGWNIYQSEFELNIHNKMDLIGEKLDNIFIIKYGLRTGSNEKYIIDSIEKSEGTKIVTGSDIERYVFNWKPKYLITKNGLPSSYFQDNELKRDKIVIQYVRTNSTKPDARWLECTYIQPDYVGLNSLSFIFSTNFDSYSIKYLLTLLNSKLMNKYYRLTYTDVNVKPAYLSKLPIRRISFTTPPDRRAALVEQAKALYSEFVGAPGAEDLDRINRIDRINTAANPVYPVHPVQTAASLSTAPDSLKILEFIKARLSAAPEESDVVHDLLAYLAERMIDINKDKNTEIKGFLRWLEGEIGAPVEELTNKTGIKEYYEAGFDVLAGALAKNKKKLKEGYDPTRREPKEKLQAEFNASVGKLAPLLKRIDMTDKLIDQIVYKLYGLTSEEIKIVDESISGGKDAKETEIAG